METTKASRSIVEALFRPRFDKTATYQTALNHSPHTPWRMRSSPQHSPNLNIIIIKSQLTTCWQIGKRRYSIVSIKDVNEFNLHENPASKYINYSTLRTTRITILKQAMIKLKSTIVAAKYSIKKPPSGGILENNNENQSALPRGRTSSGKTKFSCGWSAGAIQARRPSFRRMFLV